MTSSFSPPGPASPSSAFVLTLLKVVQEVHDAAFDRQSAFHKRKRDEQVADRAHVAITNSVHTTSSNTGSIDCLSSWSLGVGADCVGASDQQR